MLLDLRLGAVLLIFVMLAVLAAQVPVDYHFAVGKERGIGSDAPFLAGFYPREDVHGGDPNLATEWFRWSKGPEASLTLPAVGQRGLVLEFDVVSHQAQWDPAAAPTVVELRSAAGATIPVPLRRAAATYRVYIPPAMVDRGRLALFPSTPIWQLPGDSRDELGFALARDVRIRSVGAPGLVLPDLRLLSGWAGGLVLLWLMLRLIGFAARPAQGLLLPLAAGIPLLLLVSAPRVGFTSGWIITVSLMSLALGGLCRWQLPPLLRRMGVNVPASLLPWLILLIVVSFALKYGGRLYPDSMPGDIQLHVNRYGGTLRGQVYLVAQHRGLPFPFPPGLYVLLAPLTLTGLDIRDLFQIAAGMFEAASVLLLYVLVVFAGGSPRTGVLAGAIYACTAMGFMTTWFSFQTQTEAMFFSIALMTLLVARWPNYGDPWTFWLAVLVLIQVFVGHIGQFINTLLMAGLVLPALWWRSRGGLDERTGVRQLLLIGLVASGFVGLFYYSGFIGLILEQVAGVAGAGLNELTGKRPIQPETTLRVLWHGGLITHYGFFTVVLALAGGLLLGFSRMGRGILPALIWGTFAVSTVQALLPLYTLSSISTRWLSFAGWAVAVAGALGYTYLLGRGRVARLVSLAMALYVGWITATIYIEAMLLRKPPIEPF